MNLFDLAAKITLDSSGYEKGVENARGGIGKLSAWTVAKGQMMADAITQGAKALAGFGKAAVMGYADTQQLVGGLDTIFEDLSWDIQESAKNAYKTAGMSANQYMETVMGFSASLTSSLRATQGNISGAAERSDRIIQDMADNVNKMGSSMESVQMAYQGFAKGNYSMLDNLKLGYGGSMREMARLVNESGVLGDAYIDLADTQNLGARLQEVGFAKITEAIGAVQDKMGITGTTQAEAAGTISGSIGMVKGAWADLVAGMANPEADIGELIGNLTESVQTAAGNVGPAIEQTLNGIGTMVENLAPVIGEAIPTFITNALPHLLAAGVSMLQGMATGIVNALPGLAETAKTTVLKLAAFIKGNAPTIISKGFDMLGNFAFGIIEAIPGMVAKLPDIIKAFSEFIVENFPVFVKKGGELLGKLLAGLLGAIPEIALQIPDIIKAIVEAFEDGYEELKKAGKYLLEGLWAGIGDKVDWLKGKVHGVVDTIKGWFTGKEGFDEHSPSKWSNQVFRYVMDGGGNGIDAGTAPLLRKVDRSVDRVKAHMDYGAVSIPYAETAMGRHTAAMADTIMAAAPAGGGVYHIHIDVDGHEMAETIFDPLRGVVGQRGYGLA